MPPIRPINDTTFEVELHGGDKVEIGDRKSANFKPHLKLNRWDGECFIKVGLPTKAKKLPIVEGERIKWVESDREARFYALEPDGEKYELGGFEFEVILKKKPKTNQIVLNIETQGLKFYYQPELTPEEIANGCIRPDNVVGSYAVYHATKQNHIIGQTNYKCGKAFHIYRPKIVDAEGNWAWGELSLDEKDGTLTTTIPQEFLDKAVYPISHAAGQTFGFTDKGGTGPAVKNANYIFGSKFQMDNESGQQAVSIHPYIKYNSGNAKVEAAIYDSDENKIEKTEEKTITSEQDDFLAFNLDTSPELTAEAYYWLLWNSDVNLFAYYDAGDTDQALFDGETYGSWPASLAPLTYPDYKYSIYCTYETGGGVTEKTSSDVGSGADAKASGNPQATLVGTGETGSGADAKASYPSASLTKAETGSGTEALGDRDAALFETGSGLDALVLLAKALFGSDIGSGTEALVGRAIYLSESGLGAEASLILAVIAAVESGAGVDAVVVIAKALFGSDIGSAVDVLEELAAILEKSDAGSGAESLGDRDLARPEVGSGADVVAQAVAALQGSDQGYCGEVKEG